jgi:phosphoglycerol transferase MdoB-like AlkP superfamily enzyme
MNTLPMELVRLGYRTVANYPSSLSFMNTGSFYRSIGFTTVNAPDDTKIFSTEHLRPRDLEYYDFIVGDIAARRASGDASPLFYFTWTMATHYPYAEPAFPELRPDEFVEGNHVAEYARRQRIAADDLASFEKRLEQEFPGEPFLVVGFGDHHPVITYGYFEDADAPYLKRRAAGETASKTYYRVDGINFEPDYNALSDDIEIGFLADSILAAARLPMSESFAARAWLRHNCGGRWSTCEDHATTDIANYYLSNGSTSLFVRD